VESLRKVNVVGMSNPSSEQDELIQHIVDPGSDATHDREAVKTLAGSLDHLTGELLQTRFQIDKASKGSIDGSGATSEDRRDMRGGALVRDNRLCSCSVLTAARACRVRRTHLGAVASGRRDLGSPQRVANENTCEAVAPREGLAPLDLAYRCLPDTVDPRGPKGK
jgi:hypothetical protein